jgi:hypothetical protein
MLKRLILWLFALSPALAYSLLAIIPGARQRLGGDAIAESASGVAFGGLEVIRAKYKFSEDGGAVSTINLMDAANVPSGFVVWDGYLDVIVALTSAGAAEAALQVEAANDLVSVVVISGAPWSTTGRKAIVPVGTVAASKKTTAARNISLVVTVAALTAGEFDVYLMGIRT